LLVHSDEDTQNIEKEYKFKVQSIQPINHNSFVIHEDGTNNVRLLTLEYEGTSFFEEKLLFRESSHDITKILANKN